MAIITTLEMFYISSSLNGDYDIRVNKRKERSPFLIGT